MIYNLYIFFYKLIEIIAIAPVAHPHPKYVLVHVHIYIINMLTRSSEWMFNLMRYCTGIILNNSHMNTL